MKPLYILTTIINGVTVIIEVYPVGSQAVYAVGEFHYCTGLMSCVDKVLEAASEHIQSITQPITTL